MGVEMFLKKKEKEKKGGGTLFIYGFFLEEVVF